MKASLVKASSFSSSELKHHKPISITDGYFSLLLFCSDHWIFVYSRTTLYMLFFMHFHAFLCVCRVHPAHLPASAGAETDRRPDRNSHRLGKRRLLRWGCFPPFRALMHSFHSFHSVHCNWVCVSLLLGHLANVLQEANVPIISDAVCNAPDYYDSQITTSMFCAGYEKGGTDACQVSVDGCVEPCVGIS